MGNEQSTALAIALARGSEFRVTLAMADRVAAQQARRELSGLGMLGTQVAVHSWQPPVVPYRPYTFNLVVLTGSPQIDFREAVRVVRPCGGVLIAEQTPSGAEGSRPARKTDRVSGRAISLPISPGCCAGSRSVDTNVRRRRGHRLH